MASINNKLQISTKHALTINSNTHLSLDILHMSTVNLREYIEKEVSENSFLEVKDYDYDSSFNLSSGGISTSDIIEQTAEAGGQSLLDFLTEQINLSSQPQKIKTISEILISYIDNDGYIKTALDEISDESGYSVKDIKPALSFLQTLEPFGIASTSLEQSLIIQLKNKNSKYSSLAIKIIEKYFEALSEGQYSFIAMKLSSTVEDIENAKSLISSLEPYPARIFDNEAIEYVVPELFIFKEKGIWTVKINDNAIPHLQINKKYSRLKSDIKDNETLSYLKNQESKANNLIKFIGDRQKTLYKVGCVLLDMQKDFFEYGKEAITPLRLKDIAFHEDIGLSESTVSRLANKKYLQTVWGIFALKYFFSSSLSCAHSSQAVKEMIKRIIASSSQRLSDEKIKNILKSEGVNIARRTVSKYRYQLKIPSSRIKYK